MSFSNGFRSFIQQINSHNHILGTIRTSVWLFICSRVISSFPDSSDIIVHVNLRHLSNGFFKIILWSSMFFSNQHLNLLKCCRKKLSNLINWGILLKTELLKLYGRLSKCIIEKACNSISFNTNTIPKSKRRHDLISTLHNFSKHFP
jgi:hypothetical protein